MVKIILFYDGDCGLCNHAVQFALAHDTKGIFHFASLHGETAKKLLSAWNKNHPGIDSIILWEDQGKKISYYSKAIFRTAWLLGGWWKISGVLGFLPNWVLYPFNLLYRLIAYYRKSVVCLHPQSCKLGLMRPGSQFLP